MKIIFTNIDGNDSFRPEPASHFLPEWYKKTDSYLTKKKEPISGDTSSRGTPATIKKCIPVFDVITSGYLIFSTADLFIKQIEDNGKTVPYYQWTANDLITFHPTEQASLHPLNNNLPIPKWMNQWSVKTPKGYSCFVTTPIHRNLPFTIFPGIVDTDRYDAPINFPFMLNNPEFTGLIPAGTPIAQLIPFKRDSWKMEYGTKENAKNAINSQKEILIRFFDAYKNYFWSKKEFK